MEAILDPEIEESYKAILTSSQRATFAANAAAIQAAAQNANSLPDFLAQYGRLVADLLAASTVSIWFASSTDSKQLQRKVNVGGEHFLLDEVTAPAHDLLLSHVIESGKPVAIQPFSAPEVGAGVSNPTDSFVLVTPVKFLQRDIAVLEIALGPKPLRRPHQALVVAYLEWLQWLGRLLQTGIEQSFVQGQPLLGAMDTLTTAAAECDSLQEQMRLQLERSLKQLAGQNFGSLSANQAVAKQVHTLLDSKGLRVQCPECQNAAILRCQKAGNSKTGAFMFDHYLDSGRTFHGGSSAFPALTLVPKPARRNAKS